MSLCCLWSWSWWLRRSGWLGNTSEVTLKSNSPWARSISLLIAEQGTILAPCLACKRNLHTTMNKKRAGSNFWAATWAFFMEPQVPCKRWICTPGKGEANRQFLSVLGLEEWPHEHVVPILSFPSPVFSVYVLKIYLPALWNLFNLRTGPNSWHR